MSKLLKGDIFLSANIGGDNCQWYNNTLGFARQDTIFGDIPTGTSVTFIPNTYMFIHDAQKPNEFKFYKGDGTTVPVTGLDGESHQSVVAAASGDGSTVAWYNYSAHKIYLVDVASASMIRSIFISESIANNMHLSLSDDGQYVMIGAPYKKLHVYDRDTGDEVYVTSSTHTTNSSIWIEEHQEFLYSDASHVYRLPKATWVPDTNNPVDHHGGNRSGRMVLSPDKTKLFLPGYSYSEAEMLNVSDYSEDTNYPITADGRHNMVWLSENEILHFDGDSVASNTLFMYFTYDGANYSTPQELFRSKPSNSFEFDIYRGLGYQVTVDITDNAEETDFIATVYTTTGLNVGSKTLMDGTTSFTVDLVSDEPVNVVITSAVTRGHEPNHTYSVGDKILASDSQYSFECTTAGTTALDKPAYPNTAGATVTDGSAVFTVRHKLPQPIVIGPLTPTPVAGNMPKYPTITLLGDNPLLLNVGDTYTDPGATAVDNNDGSDITANIVVSGNTVDTSTAGDYYVIYRVTASGRSTTRSRKVTVS